MVDFPDWTRGIAIDVTIEDPDYPTALVGRPKGETRERSHATTNTSTFTEIVSYVPASGKRFYLAKVEAPTRYAQHVQVLLDAEVVGDLCTFDCSGYLSYFPFDTFLDGDGSKKVLVQAKAITTVEDVYGIIQGEEVDV